MGLTLSLVGGALTRNTRTCPDCGLAPAEHNVFSLEPPSHLLKERGWDTLQPGGGLECCAWGGVLGSQTHTAQQWRQSRLPKSVWYLTRLRPGP